MSANFSQCMLRSTLLLALLFGACIASAAETDGEVERFVHVVARDGGAANEHPRRINPARLVQALGQLKIVPKHSRRTKDADSLFSEEVAKQLGKDIAVALRRAKPDQDIMFQVVDSRPFLGFFEKDAIINGRVFWRRGLNIIFGAVHKGPRRRWILGRVVDVSLPGMASRKRIADFSYRIVTQPGIDFIKTRSGRVRHDWVRLDLRRIAAAAPAAEDDAGDTAPAGEPRLPASVEGRLERLKRLRAKGLISQRQYDRKVEQILDQL